MNCSWCGDKIEDGLWDGNLTHHCVEEEASK